MPRGQREGFTARTEQVEKLMFYLRTVAPGDSTDFSQMSAAAGVNLKNNRDILNRSRHKLENEHPAVYFDSVRGIGLQRRRPIDFRYGSNRGGDAVHRRSTKEIKSIKATDIMALTKDEQACLQSHAGKWGFIQSWAKAISKEGAPPPPKATHSDISPVLASMFGQPPKDETQQ